MEGLSNFFTVIDSYLGASGWFPYALLGTGLFFTLYLKFPQLRYFRHAFAVVRGKYEKKEHEGDTSHFQALTTALSGTVGTGNIAGVALAIYLGGPAALFWMWATAFFGMTLKFVEVTLSHKHREKAADGSIAGGPMYYMKKRLNIKKADGSVISTGKFLGAFFAVATVISSFGTGNLPQIHSIATGLKATFGVTEWYTGAVLAVILSLIIIGGIKRIAQVTERIVPTMAFIYIVGAAAVIVTNIGNVVPSFIAIFSDAFTGSAAAGGFLGATFSFAFVRGVGRGLFSNEAGQGSAPIAHAAARADEPVSEGIVAILEPFIDTIVICTITGLVILSSGVWQEKFDNTFQRADTVILAGDYSESNPVEKEQVTNYLFGRDGGATTFSGTIQVANGRATNNGFTVVHARSFADDVKYKELDGQPFTGELRIEDGLPVRRDIELEGRSLVHSVVLTTEAFKRGLFGDWGEYIVAIGLLLFAFSTAISWSYYGDRAMIYLFGSGSVHYYRVVYVLGFFGATLIDTSIVWIMSGVAIAIMTLPNLLGILILHREMKSTVGEYVVKFNTENPGEKRISK